MMIPLQGVLAVLGVFLAIAIPLAWYQGYQAAKYDEREEREWLR